MNFPRNFQFQEPFSCLRTSRLQLGSPVSCVHIHSETHGKIALTLFFPLDFCGKPKPSTEFCVQSLGFARVWSRSAAQTPSSVHVSDSTSWQRVTDAANRGWRCSTLGCYCSKGRLKLLTFNQLQKTDPVPLTVFGFAKELWRWVSGQLWGFTFCWKESANTGVGLLRTCQPFLLLGHW